MTKVEFIETLNKWGAARTAFLFIVDFEFNKPLVIKLDDIDAEQMLYDLRGKTNSSGKPNAEVRLTNQRPPSFSEYQAKFNQVIDRLHFGDSYLTNLTIKTEIDVTGNLSQLFANTIAPYKLYLKDQFLVFSPETFVRITGQQIFSYPMKGTIDSSVPQAREKILADQKELAEHVTIVDLIRNDLSQVAFDVHVPRFRFVQEIKTGNKNLLQVSSEVSGTLSPNYRDELGSILATLLPAGSVSGAPKPKTLEIISQAEGEPRGYYTGIFGYFDGTDLDSAVMIRYIETHDNRFFYRSGGGLTTQSSAELEYQEALDKVYLPLG
jgi:para-aminobenzoate synthetase component I